MKFFTLFFTFLSLGYSAFSNETNSVFVTDDYRIFIFSTNAPRIQPAKLEEAKKLRECLPAQDFPEGNWGEVKMGIQASLRFYKQNYSNGEPVRAIVLIRNTSTNFFMFLGANPIIYDSPVYFQATVEAGGMLRSKKTRPDMLVVSGGGTIPVHPGTQRKFILPLNDLFNFTNGVYAIQASVFAADGLPKNDTNTIQSAKVKLEIK